MSTSAFYPWPCGRVRPLCGLLLLLACFQHLTAGRLTNCSHPLVPEHGGFRCDPSPCRGFPHKMALHFFCEPGYHINKARVSRCHHGTWQPPVPACVPVRGAPDLNTDRAKDPVPSMATTAVGVSIFLLTTTACLVLKSRLHPCQSHSSRRSSDQLDLVVEGLPVPLPSYEEAVYGSWGQRLPPSCGAPGPTQLLLAREAPGCHQSPDAAGHADNPPPPYEEVHHPPRAGHELRMSPSDDKDS